MAGQVLGPDPRKQEEGGGLNLPPDHHMIAQDILSAIKADDHEGLSDALRAHYLSCGGIVPEEG